MAWSSKESASEKQEEWRSDVLAKSLENSSDFCLLVNITAVLENVAYSLFVGYKIKYRSTKSIMGWGNFESR